MILRHLRLAFAASIAVTAACGGRSSGRDHGAPSGVYPAPHPALPQVQRGAGPVQSAPRFVSVTWPGDPFAPFLDDFVARIGATQYWAAAGTGYGIGVGTAGAPVHVSSPAPPTITDTALEAWLASMLNGSHPEFGTPTANTQYLLFTPKNMVITGAEVSCVTFAAYHAAVITTGGRSIAYDLVPRCDGYAGLSDLDEVTEAAGHEMIEAASDPQVLSSSYGYADTDAASATWDLLSNGGELGDMCEWQDGHDVRPDDLPYVIQRSWSNVRAAASHDPCVPAEDLYFNAAPVLVDDVRVPVADIGPIVGKGIKLPVGRSKMIEVDLFSDGPTRPFSLAAVDEATMAGLAPELALHFDKDTGVNGEKSWLTVTSLRAGSVLPGRSVFFIESTLDGRTEYWPVLVEN